MKNALTEMKNTLQGIDSGADEAGDQIIDLEDKEAKNIPSEEQKIKNN